MTERVVIDETKVDYEKEIVREEFIRRTDDIETYPSGWKYRLHYGTLDGETIVRYDNSHGEHERHPPEDGESIEFESMEELWKRFEKEVAEHER